MTNFKRRLVSTALAVTMAVTLLPLPANAADGTQDISIGWNAQEPQTKMEQVTVDLTAKLENTNIESVDVYIALSEEEADALTLSDENSDVTLVTELPAEDTSDDTEEPDAEETGEEGSGEEPGDQDQGQGQQPSEPNPDDSQGTETPPESTEGNKEPDSEDAETEGDSSGDSDNTGVPTTPEDSTIPEDPEPSQDPTESPAAEESAVAPVSASAGEDLSILRESPRGVSAASLTRDGDVGGDSRIPAGEPEGTSGHYLFFTLSNKEGEKASIETELTFKLPEGEETLAIDVTENDIHLRNVVYTSGETGSTPSIDLSMPTLTLNSAKPEFSLDTDNLEPSMEIDQNAKTLAVTFPFTATVPEGSASYTFLLTLPKGVRLPDGDLSASGLSIQAGEDTKVAEVTGLTGATISDPTFTDQTLTFTLTIGEADADLVEEVLNALSDGDASVTFSNLQVSFNDLFGPGNDNPAIQLEVTQKDPEDGETTEPQSASIALTSPEVKPEYTPGNTAPVTQSVTWLDNNNTEGRRPDYKAGEFYPEIHYTIKDTDGQTIETGTLNSSNLKKFGFEEWPAITGTSTSFSFTLPTTLSTFADPYGNTTTYTIDWTFQPPEVEGYRLEVGEGEDNTWTYTLTEDFTFTLAMKRGYPGESLSEKEVMALLSQFDFQGQTNVTGGTADSLDLPDFADIVDLTITKGPDDTYTITIPGLAAYGENNAPLVYWVTEKESTAPDKVTYEELAECQDTLLPEGKGEKGDYYKIAYDNAGVADAGSSTTATYSGGKLTLTLTGVTQYQATKIWLDTGDITKRPKAEFELWRYAIGQDPSQAAQLRWKDVVEGGDNNFIVIDGEDLIPISEETTEPDTGDEGTTDNDTPATLDGETVTDPSEGGDDATPDEEVTEPEITTQSEFRIVFKDNAGNPLDLPKYDPDGKRYTYGVREYLTGGTNHYEQVFGEVDADGNVIEGTDILPYNGARANDTLVYNKGILSNRVTNTATASVTKIWEAAAYQAAFEDVAVEFTLYVRVKPEEGTDTSADANWKEYQENGNAVTCVLHNFSAESMTDSTSQGGLDLYDATGQELEYRWVETAVYQGVEDDNLSNEKRIEISTENLSQASFTLTQTAADGKTPKDVVYQSETEYRANQTTVTNSVEDTVDFALAKEWAKDVDDDQKTDVTFHIYQTLAGNDFNFDTPYVSVTIPKDESKDPYLVGEDGNSIPSISPAEGVTITLTSDAEDIINFNTQNPNRVPDDYEDWDAIVQNLPLYDETGHLYNYFVLEAAPESGDGVVSPSYERGYYPATGDYSCVITNGPGKQVVLMVQKNWIDDGDALHREPVTVGVYYEKDGNLEPLMDGENAVTHEINNNTGSWTDFIYIPGDLLKDKEGNELTAKDLYIVEQTVGEDAKVTHGTSGVPTVAEWEKGYTGTADTDTSIFQVSTDHHRYQVTYERLTDDPAVPANVDALYVVTNRRLGTVDMTVNKTWVSGGQEDANEGLQILTEALDAVNNSETNNTDLALAFQLQFASKPKDDWKIDGDTVSVGGPSTENVPILDSEGNAAASIQVILGPNNTNNTNFSFCNLPKYDEQGAVVAYTVEEVWVSGSDGNWKVLDNGLDDSSIESLDGLENLQTIWSEYRAAITSQNYTVGSHDVNPGGNAPAEDSTDAVQTILNTNPAGTRRDQDKQHITYTNTRAQTKEVKWYKVWRDNFADQQGNRPDLYLDIYRVVHEDGKELIELVKKDYRWQVVTPGTTQESETKIDGSSADVTTGTNAANDVWSVTLHGVEKYDREGYEIQYFAVERTAVRVSDFDYQAAQYAYSSEGHATDIIGDRDGKNQGEGFGNYTLDLNGNIAWKNADDKPTNIGEFQGSGSQGIAYPQYALLENGTFINTLANSFPVTGMKRWVDLPSGYLSNDPDLPTVTFHVYRSTDANDIPTDGKPVASLTIESGNWASMAKSGSSYSFRIDYEGANVVSVNDGEVRFVPADGNKDAKKLPLYDGNGNRYYYKATEAMAFVTPDTPEAGEDDTVTQVATGTPAVDQVYEVNQDMAGNFTFVNTYAPDVGGLKVKKILSLPADTTAENGGFPAVSFTLKRTYTTSDNTPSEPETVVVKDNALTWSSGDVQAAFTEATKDPTSTNPVLLEHVFEVTGLPIYAPNGSKYVYSIQENTGYLGGYLTYAADGDVEVSAFTGEETSTEIDNLAPEKVTTEDGEATATELDVQATFYNVWEDDQETVTLSGTKAWQGLWRRHGHPAGAAHYNSHRRRRRPPGPGGDAHCQRQ